MSKAKQENLPAPTSGMVPVTQSDLTQMKSQRKLLKDFIRSQLKEAKMTHNKKTGKTEFGDGDYGTIPGTPKASLLKPGAEKLLRLFNLGVKLDITGNMVEKHENFAMFDYKATVYHLQTGAEVAQCEGSCNSQEKKYRTRKVWEKNILPNGKEVRTYREEETPIFDILNTLKKMAQKRAIVGATLLAVSGSDFFTQDLADEFEPDAPRDVESEVTEKVPVEKEEAAPECCGRAMMVSKYKSKEFGPVAPWYCVECKGKIRRDE